jgi:hypothetical protein
MLREYYLETIAAFEEMEKKCENKDYRQLIRNVIDEMRLLLPSIENEETRERAESILVEARLAIRMVYQHHYLMTGELVDSFIEEVQEDITRGTSIPVSRVRDLLYNEMDQ